MVSCSHPRGANMPPMNLYSLIQSDLHAKARWMYGSASFRNLVKARLTDGTTAMILSERLPIDRQFGRIMT